MSADIVFTETSFPTGVVGVAYAHPIGIKSAASALTGMTVATGALPDGLVVNADKTRITGTPTKTGAFTFTLSAVDTGGTTTSGTLTMSVTANPHDAGLTFGNAPAATLVARLAPLTVA